MHILIVEDSKATREPLALILISRGNWVKTAANGAEAKAFMSIGPMPDRILVDYYMPGETGLDFLKFVRGQRGGENIPVVMMTAAEEKIDELKEQTRDMGPVLVLVKPFDHESLMKVMA